MSEAGKEPIIYQNTVCDQPGQIINETLSDLALAHKHENNEIFYPGEMSYKKRKENLQQGIPVDKKIWNKILKM